MTIDVTSVRALMGQQLPGQPGKPCYTVQYSPVPSQNSSVHWVLCYYPQMRRFLPAVEEPERRHVVVNQIVCDPWSRCYRLPAWTGLRREVRIKFKQIHLVRIQIQVYVHDVFLLLQFIIFTRASQWDQYFLLFGSAWSYIITLLTTYQTTNMLLPV